MTSLLEHAHANSAVSHEEWVACLASSHLELNGMVPSALHHAIVHKNDVFLASALSVLTHFQTVPALPDNFWTYMINGHQNHVEFTSMVISWVDAFESSPECLETDVLAAYEACLRNPQCLKEMLKMDSQMIAPPYRGVYADAWARLWLSAGLNASRQGHRDAVTWIVDHQTQLFGDVFQSHQHQSHLNWWAIVAASKNHTKLLADILLPITSPANDLVRVAFHVGQEWMDSIRWKEALDVLGKIAAHELNATLTHEIDGLGSSEIRTSKM